MTWNYVGLDAQRSQTLLQASKAQILDDLRVETLNAIMRSPPGTSCSLEIGELGGSVNPTQYEFVRLKFEVQVSPEYFDLFFNGKGGLRGQYFQSPEDGETFSSDATSSVVSLLAMALISRRIAVKRDEPGVAGDGKKIDIRVIARILGSASVGKDEATQRAEFATLLKNQRDDFKELLKQLVDTDLFDRSFAARPNLVRIGAGKTARTNRDESSRIKTDGKYWAPDTPQFHELVNMAKDGRFNDYITDLRKDFAGDSNIGKLSEEEVDRFGKKAEKVEVGVLKAATNNFAKGSFLYPRKGIDTSIEFNGPFVNLRNLNAPPFVIATKLFRKYTLHRVGFI